jgi:hypothetical protein
MSAVNRIEIDVSEEVARYLDTKVSCGGFADRAAAVVAALDAVRLADAEAETWLSETVGPTLDRMDRDGWSDLSADEVHEEIRLRNAQRTTTA